MEILVNELFPSCQTDHKDDDREPLLHVALAALLHRQQPLPHHSAAAAVSPLDPAVAPVLPRPHRAAVLHDGPTRLPAGHHAHAEKPLHDGAACGEVCGLK